jgi:TonB family protein
MKTTPKKLIFILLYYFTFLTICLGQNENFKLNYNKATQAANAGKYQEAIRLYTLSIDEYPTTDAYFDRSSVYELLKDSCNFCKDLLRAAELGDIEARGEFQKKCTRTEVLTKIPDSLKARYPKIIQVTYNYRTCNQTYIRDIVFLDKNKIECTETTKYSKDSVYSYVSTYPEYVGGEKARNRFLAQHIHYPDDAAKNWIQGTVYLTFVVNEDGLVKDIKVLRGIGGGCDEEAVRVVKLMPTWKPGTQNGKPMNVLFYMPVYFKL